LIGLKIRVPNAPIYLQLFRTLEASPIPLPYSQILRALKQGTASAEENCLETIKDGRFYEAAPYITLTGHSADSGIVLIDGKRMASLPDEQQRLLRDIFDKLTDRLSEQVHAEEIKDMETLEEKGVTFITIDRKALAAKVAPLLKGGNFAWSGEIYERLQKIP
jgi:TRAP-type C4-dicarboxylate transport system substrate-binding protein